MKKNTISVFLLLLVCALLVTDICLTMFEASKDYTTCGKDGFVFAKCTISGGSYQIVQYDGRNKIVTLPTEYNGKIACFVDEFAFTDSGVISITAPEGYGTIHDYAFAYNDKLENVTITDALLVTGNAWKGCKNLKTLTAVNVYINGPRDNTLQTCPNLTDLYLELENLGDLYAEYIKDHPNITNVTLKNAKHIAQEAFSNCPNLTTLTLDSKLEKIYDGAFENCPNLKTIIYYGDEELWNSRFADFPAFQNVEVRFEKDVQEAS